MKIAIDASGAAREEPTGVGAYIRGLTGGLAAKAPDDNFFLYYRFSRLKDSQLFLKPPADNFRIVVPPIHLLSARGIDVAHGPDARLFKLGRAKTVVTVHDVFSVVSPDWADKEFREKKKKRYSEISAKADLIICDSQSTADDFVNFFPETESRTRIVHLGISPGFAPVPEEKHKPILEKSRIRKPYILHVGNIARRKNLTRLVGAFDKIAGKHAGLSLVLAGRLSYGHENVLEKIEKSSAGNRIILTGYLPSEDLPALYGGSQAFVFPSLYEGFGLPALEAMACGTPVAASKISSLPEVLGDNGVLFDPENENDIAEAIDSLLSDESRRKELADAGKKHAKEFSWERTAEETLKIYREVGS